MIVGMFGSRFGCDERIVYSILRHLKNRFGDNLYVLVGDCIGVDEIVYNCCKKLGIKVGVVKVWRN